MYTNHTQECLSTMAYYHTKECTCPKPEWILADLHLTRDKRYDSLYRAGHTEEEINKRLAPLDREIAELKEKIR